MSHPIEAAKGILQPVQIYPIFETALRAARGESIEAHIVRVSELWAAFSRVAAGNPYAWIRTAKTAEEIRTPSPSNRMIGLPYPKQMNSNNDVDMAAALLVCSVERAEALGIPRDRWVFLHAGTDAHDTYATSERWELHRVPAVRVAGKRALDLAGTGIDDIAFIDLYSCFPSMVQMSATELGIPLETERSLTQTGGLPFAGGPWNNYVMHAIATVVARCREHPGELGFIHANGGFATKHAFGVYSSEPPASGFRWEDCQSEVDRMPTRGVADGAEAAGPARIEGYTVMHDRDGQPEFAIAACRRADDRRAWGTSRDRGVVRAMCHDEWVGRAVELDREGGLHP
jgi:acetyl-CoA C-acetyltransferase